MAIELRVCKCCGFPKPYDRTAKKDSKASGFHGAKCWECYIGANRETMRKIRATEEGRAKTNAANRKIRATEEGRAKSNVSAVKSQCKRLKTDAWYRLRCRFAQETNRVLTLIANGGTPKDATCLKLFGAPLLDVVIHFNKQLDERGLGWDTYKTGWVCDHRVPVALAENDNALRRMFYLENTQVLTLEEHALKTLEDNDLVRRSSMAC